MVHVRSSWFPARDESVLYVRVSGNIPVFVLFSLCTGLIMSLQFLACSSESLNGLQHTMPEI
jgi:hypothetical protein